MRVLWMHSLECPETIRGEEDAARMERRMRDNDVKHLTSAAFACKTILPPPQDSDGVSSSGCKVLLVLTWHCDIKVHNALGALRHFGIRPEPQ